MLTLLKNFRRLLISRKLIKDQLELKIIIDLLYVDCIKYIVGHCPYG